MLAVVDCRFASCRPLPVEAEDLPVWILEAPGIGLSAVRWFAVPELLGIALGDIVGFAAEADGAGG